MTDLATSGDSVLPVSETACSRCGCLTFAGGDTARYCAACGHSREDHATGRCGRCGASAAPGIHFCTGCGAPLTQAARNGTLHESDSPRAEQIGDAVGRGVKAGVSSAARPVVHTVWKDRPNIPLWQKILGIPAWVLLVFNPVGWAILGATFVVLVLVGRRNVYEWIAWVTKWGAILAIAAVVIGVIAIIAIASSDSNEYGYSALVLALGVLSGK